MRFTPKTDEQIKSESTFTPWPAGQYGFKITDAKDSESHAGNEMIVLKLNVYNDEGRVRIVDDYLLEQVAYKLKHACQACGLEAEYNNSLVLASDFAGKEGVLKLGIQKGKKKEGSDEYYPDKNVVLDYIVSKKESTTGFANSPEFNAPIDDDNVPF